MNKNINMLVGDRLQDIRKKKGWSQEDLGAQLGLSRTSIINMEAGRQTLTMENLYKVCLALECDPQNVIPTIRELGDEYIGPELVALVHEKDPTKLRKMLMGFL